MMATTDPRAQLIIPTAINVLLMVNDTILRNRRNGFDAQIIMPSLRDRAKLIVYEAGVVPVQAVATPDPSTFTR